MDGQVANGFAYKPTEGGWLAPDIFSGTDVADDREYVCRNGVMVPKRERKAAPPNIYTVPAGAIGAKWRANYNATTEGTQLSFSIRATTNASVPLTDADFNLSGSFYGFGGPAFFTGTNGYYYEIAGSASTTIWAAMTNTSQTYTSMGEGWVVLKRASSAALFPGMANLTGYSNISAAYQYERYSRRIWVNAAAFGTALQITGLRFSTNTGSGQVYCWSEVEWMY